MKLIDAPALTTIPYLTDNNNRNPFSVYALGCCGHSSSIELKRSNPCFWPEVAPRRNRGRRVSGLTCFLAMTLSQLESLHRSGGEKPQRLESFVAQSPLKRRSAASLSVRLRPNPSKRMKPSPINREEIELNTMEPQHTSLETFLSVRSKSLKHPGSARRVSKSAEQWYNDTNKNVTNLRDAAAYLDSKSLRDR